MKIGNVNSNISSQNRIGSKMGKKGINTTDVFTPSSGEKAVFKSIPTSLKTGDAGKLLMGDNSEARAAFTNTVEKPQWRNHGGVSYMSELVCDPENNGIYAGVEEYPDSSEPDYYLTAFNSDGTMKWRYEADKFTNGPILDEKGVTYFSGDNDLHAIDTDGRALWHAYLNDLRCVGASPVISPNGTVFAIDMDRKNKTETSKINAVKNGKVQWTYHIKFFDRRSHSMIAGKDGSLYLAVSKNVREKKGLFSSVDKTQNFFIGLNSNGTEKFRIPVKDWGTNHEDCLAEGPDGTIYTIQESQKLAAYTPQGKKKFELNLTGQKKNSAFPVTTGFPPVTDKVGNLYIAAGGSQTNNLICLNKDGKEKWRTFFEKGFVIKPHITKDGDIVVGLKNGSMQVLDKNGDVKNRFQVRSGKYKDNYTGKMEGDEPIGIWNITSDNNRQVFVASKNWVTAYDLDAEPMKQELKEDGETLENPESKTTDPSIKMEEESVVIGGIKLKKNKPGK